MRLLLTLSALFVSFAAHAQLQLQLQVSDAWVRSTVASQKATGAFMQLTSAKGAKVVAVSSPVAEVAEIHEMKMDDGVMKMRAVDALPLPAGQPVALKPGGFHVMLMGLKAPVQAGATVPLTLTLEDDKRQRSTVEVRAEVRAAAPMGH